MPGWSKRRIALIGSVIGRFGAGASGATAVEFALVMPLFLLLAFATIAYTTIVSTYSGVQQLVAEGARASVAGLSDTERDQLARAFISANVGAYPFLDAGRLTVSTAAIGGPTPAFRVTVNYNMSTMAVYGLAGLVPLPNSSVVRNAIVQRGGY